MTARKNQTRHNIFAFAFLFLVSLYRQISLRFLPDDPLRTYILYSCYVVLTIAWALSIQMRVTQKSTRRFLLLEDLMIFAGLTVRFVQDTFWYENIPLMRVSGQCIAATVLPILALGIYASLGIGKADDFKIPKRWYLLLIPVMVMTYLTVTDEKRHFICYVIQSESQPNLNFHPYIGAFLLFGLGIAFTVFRVLLIFKNSRLLLQGCIRRFLISAFEPIIASISLFGFFAVSLRFIPDLAGVEVIEMYAKIYYIEALTWEIYMYLGLVPTNSDYKDIFMQSTAAMQIIGKDGTHLYSEGASPVPKELMEELVENKSVSLDSNSILRLYSMPDTYFVWKNDVSSLNKTISELNQSAELLAQEGILLEEELKTKNEETSLRLKHQIYAELTKEVITQLRLMTELTKKRNLSTERDAILHQLFLLGTYVKRRCNLRLIQKETLTVHADDLRLSLEDMTAAMNLMGIHSVLDWTDAPYFSDETSIFIFDTLENLLEHERFRVLRVEMTAKSNVFLFLIYSTQSTIPPLAEPENCRIHAKALEVGYLVKIQEGGGTNVL